ncbi:DUF2515 family protein [Pseudomonas fitomaticsae]|uniref:Uncharacterized protein n=1 Tax=Pseudomonas fitomaticsae TaxID=2837969 RepID=A0ABY3Q451_9PSED|nr:hypothetical protein [Pseudomonas fitomaticsae]UFQ00903.1 hypothetical protein KJY40_04200 [Pseudomonas fitomaticsae]
MTRCFNELPSDAQRLNHNITPVADCECNEEMLYGERMRVTEVPVLTCQCLWRACQREAENIVAPDGVLIADPVQRNRAINAAYARLWLHDARFQWAGLAAFASKQVGCGLLHAADSIELIRQEHEARQRVRDGRRESGLLTPDKMPGQAETWAEYQEARARNPVPSLDFRPPGEELSLVQQQFRHVYDMMAMGNTTLFLDVYPLHRFYAVRGWEELKKCLKTRRTIYGHARFPVLWPIGGKALPFGEAFQEILNGFEAIDAGNIAESVNQLAWHEQRNILQPSIYENRHLVTLLRGNHFSYVTGLPSGVAQAIELTLASQCQRVDDDRTIDFGRNPLADLSDIDQRMEFVLRAAARFHQMLNDSNRDALAQSIREIAARADA